VCSSDLLQAGLGVLQAIKGEKKVNLPETTEKATVEEKSESFAKEEDKDSEAVVQEVAAAMPERAAKTLVVSLPVRSGQQILAPTGDVIVLSSVNAGGEVLAGGNIHVYGALRGRAMAGIHGDTTARIFSLQCNAELVAVAGEYIVNEMLAKDVVNRSVIISRGVDGLDFAPLG
jgi:septum site-determining protein MinC